MVTRKVARMIQDRHTVKLATVVHNLNPEGQARVGFFFTADAWTGEPHNAEPHKCAKIAWYPLDMLPHDTVPYTAASIDLYQRRQPLGLCGFDTPG